MPHSHPWKKNAPGRGQHCNFPPHGGGMLSIDLYAQHSQLRTVSPYIKFSFALAVLVLCVWADSPAVGLIVSMGMTAGLVLLGGVPLRYVLSLMSIPILFLVVSCMTIALEISRQPLGLWDLPLFGFYLSATGEGLRSAGLLFFKAYGAVSCLYFLSLTTPMQEIIQMLNSLRLPKLVIELMYLIYRYIFLLLDVQNRMAIAARSRLGYSSRRSSWYTFTHISGNLLATSFRRSSACFDAMEARGYTGTLRFLVRRPAARLLHAAVCAALFLALAALTALLKMKGVDLF